MQKQGFSEVGNKAPTETGSQTWAEITINKDMKRQWHDLLTQLRKYNLPPDVFKRAQIYSINLAMVATGLALTPSQQKSFELMKEEIDQNMKQYLKKLGLLELTSMCRVTGAWTQGQLRKRALYCNDRRVRLTTFQRMRIFRNEVLYCCGILVTLFILFLNIH